MIDFRPVLRAQHLLNLQAAGPKYLGNRLPFYRKAWAECGEMLDHLADCWWKQQTVDTDQVFLELVDVFHFVLSEVLNTYGVGEGGVQRGGELLTQSSFVSYEHETYSIEDADSNGFRTRFITGVEALVSSLISYGRQARKTRAGDNPANARVVAALQLCVEALFQLVYGSGRTLSDLMDVYTAKFALNMFRQANGYRDGSYIKIWTQEPTQVSESQSGVGLLVEDNVVLNQIMQDVQTQDGWAQISFADRVRCIYVFLGLGYTRTLTEYGRDTSDCHESYRLQISNLTQTLNVEH